MEIDHACIRLDTSEKVDGLLAQLEGSGEVASATEVNGRIINIFHLNEPVTINGKTVTYLEIPNPKEEQTYDDGWEHVEGMQTYAYYFSEDKKLIYYSGDLGKIETTADFLSGRDEKDFTVFQDINKKLDGKGHVPYTVAQEALKDYATYGYHCDRVTMPTDCTMPLVEDYPELNY